MAPARARQLAIPAAGMGGVAAVMLFDVYLPAIEQR
jgi:hypothetical protein